jgi:WD40 repeat protein
MSFNFEGDKLASVSTSPDYMLTIWDWKDELMGLHSKAFGQDVWNVKFSMDDSRRLTTSGIGHIRFWKMAATFTGLKLQGSIGKFGKIDLSDIEHFIELPDGKVVSGTESGSLLLWEGNFIKCRFIQVGNKNCHSAAVTYIDFDRNEKCLVSASLDGYIRWWDFNAIDTAEVDSDHSMDFELLPLAEIQLNGGVGVKTMLDSYLKDNVRSLILIDTAGNHQVVKFKWNSVTESSKLCDTLISHHLKAPSAGTYGSLSITVKSFGNFHSNAITGMDTCPIDHLAATCGADGSVYCSDYVNRQEIISKKFDIPATCLKWVPQEVDTTGRSFIVGFSDGTFRLLSLTKDRKSNLKLKRVLVFKPHNQPLTDFCFSESGSYLATSGRDGIIFFFHCSQTNSPAHSHWEPIKFVDLRRVSDKTDIFCDKLCWSPDDKRLLVNCSDNVLREFDTELIRNFDNSVESITFEVELPFQEIGLTVSVMASSKSGILEIVDKSKAAETSPSEADETTNENKARQDAPQETSNLQLKVNSSVYSVNRSSVSLVSSSSLTSSQHILCEYDLKGNGLIEKQFTTGLYSTDGKDFPRNPMATNLRYSWSKRFLVVGLMDGSVNVRPSEYLEVYVRCSAHNGASQGTAYCTLSFDDRFLLSAGKDGCLTIYRIRQDLVGQKAKEIFDNLEANVYGNEKTKRVPMNATAESEPSYLTSVVTNEPLPEEHLFPSPQMTKTFGNLISALIPESSDEVQDLSPNAYSIQDNRLRLEQDAKKSAAEELKDRVFASIKALRKDYEKVLKENESIPAIVRLTPAELLIDNSYFTLSKQKFAEQLQEVHNENTFDLEKAEKQLEKLKARNMNGFLMEEIPLSAFELPTYLQADDSRQPHSVVWSFRICSLDPAVREIINQVKQQVRLEELRESQQRSNDLAQKKALSAMDEMKVRLQKKEDGSSEKVDHTTINSKDKINAFNSSSGKEEDKHESTAAIRRLKRKERKEELTRHDSEKPSENDDDVRDVQAIRYAEKTIGDYKLKSADDYEVPEDQRINALKKIRQMAILEDSMMLIRLAFNEKFLLLRQLKREIIANVKRDNQRVREIDNELNQRNLSTNLWQPSLDPVEFPDDYDEVTDCELNDFISFTEGNSWDTIPSSKIPQHQIITGKKLVITKNLKSNTYEVNRRSKDIDSILGANESSQKLEILNNFLAETPNEDGTVTESAKLKFYEVNENLLSSSYPNVLNCQDITDSHINSAENKVKLNELESKVPILAMTKSLSKQRMNVSNPTRIQSKLNDQRRLKLQFERSMILSKMEETLNSFRDAVDELRVQRHQIISDLKLAEFKLLVLFQEYVLLQTFESKDNLLQQKQIKNKNDEKENQSLSYENKCKLESKLEEVQHWNDKLLSITNELKTILPENHPYYDILNKIFRKKVKRNKSHGEDEDEENEDNEDESDDDDGDDEDDELEEVEDICPPGCDQIIFEKILDLREKKVDTEEVCVDINKQIEELKRTGDRLKQREKQIGKETQQTEFEVTQFQLQKQAALNQIRVVVPLRASQLYVFELSGGLTGPTDTNANRNNFLGEDTSRDLDNANDGLRSMDSRSLVSQLKMKTHTLFTTK